MVLYVHVYAQDPYYVSINKLSGLPSNAVYDIFQDSKGFIWIANNEGLTRYDGFEFRTYINPNQTSRSGNQIEEDRYGRIWYKNFDGYLYYVEHDSLKSLKQNTTIGNTGYAILNDRLLVLQKKGIDFFDIATLKVIKSTGFDHSTLMSEAHYKDSYYILTMDTLYALGRDGITRKSKAMELSLLAGSKKGVVMMHKGNIKKYCYELIDNEIAEKIAVPEIGYVHELEYCDQMYWISTPNGVWVYDEEGKNINNGKPFFADKSISSVLKDREGNFWLGTLNEGLIFVPDLKTKLILTPNFVPNILSVVRGQLYTGTKDNAIYKYDVNKDRFELKYKDSLRHEIICFQADTINNRYSFTANRFYITDTNFRAIERSEMSVKDIAVVDKKYSALASNGNIVLVKMNADGVSDFDSLFNAGRVNSTSLFSQVITACRGRTVAYNPSLKTIYTGTSKGLFAITSKDVTEIKSNGAAIYTKRLVCFRNNLYVLTPQDQVYVVGVDKTVIHLALPEEKEQCVNMKLAGGKLYLLTNNGIRQVDDATCRVTKIYLHPGIRAEEINDMEVVNDRLVFASERGLIVISKDNAAVDSMSPGFVINSMLVNGKNAAGCNEFLYTENDIEINYSILSFSADKKYQLYYKINDGKWQVNSGVTRSLKLASLSPGAYNISFKLVSADMDKEFVQQTVRFTIKRPFWTEWWFLGGGLLILASGSMLYYRWQTSLLKKQNQLTVEKVELEKNLRNSMLTSIRSQMNPHFFYNALNSIQSFMFSDDKRNASTYLVKLSKLTRMILEMSEKENIALDEEAEALKLYLELEKMRFSADFNYELRIDSNVDSELVKIPPMIVQPYVENAIKHGLLHKKGNKYLSITFGKTGEDLLITIDDNGIGREKANELNQLKKEKHNPFSTQANSKRIELLNKGRGKNIGVVYFDKKDNQVPVGTTVIITIPLI